MTSDRAYRSARSSRRPPCDELRATAGTQFDPEVVDAFLDELDGLGDSSRALVPDADDAPVQLAAEHVRTLLLRTPHRRHPRAPLSIGVRR